MDVKNLRPFEVEIVDPADGTQYFCAARPGTVEVPDKLGRALLKQAENWSPVEESKSGKAADEGNN